MNKPYPPPFNPDPTLPSTSIPGIPGPADWQPGQTAQNETPISRLPQGSPPSGSEWVPLVQNMVTVKLALNQVFGLQAPIQKALSLYYVSSAGQTLFPLSIPDLYGNTVLLVPTITLSVTRNGVRQTPDNGTGVGGYTIDVLDNAINLLWPAGAGEIVLVDLFWQGAPGVPVSPAPGASWLGQDVLTVTAPNTLSPLSRVPDGHVFILFVEGRPFFAVGPSTAFIYSGVTVTWVSTVYSLQPGNEVMALYTSNLAPPPVDWWLLLPTTRPPTAGVLWNNGGVVCVSDGGTGGAPGEPEDWWLELPTTLPPTAGVLWNNNGVISVS